MVQILKKQVNLKIRLLLFFFSYFSFTRNHQKVAWKVSNDFGYSYQGDQKT